MGGGGGKRVIFILFIFNAVQSNKEKINTIFAVIGTGSTNTIVMPPPFPICYYFFSRVWQVEVLTILASRGDGGREVDSALSLFYLFSMQCNQIFFSPPISP